MSTRDSGIIDLFAVHEEEAARLSAPAPSAPPPAVSFDTGDDDDELDALDIARRASRTRAKIVGGAIGAMTVIGILIAAIPAGGESEPAKAPAAAAAPPPAAVTAPAPVSEPAPAPAAPEPAAAAPEPAPTAKAGPDYSRKTAAAAYAASQAKKKAPARKPAKKGGGVKLQKVQSAGI